VTSKEHPRGHGDSLGKFGRALLIVVGIFYLFVMVTFILAAFRTQAELYRSSVFGRLSVGALGYDWSQLIGFSGGIFLHWLGNTAIIAVGGALVAVAAALPAGYAMAVLEFRGRRVLLFLTLLTMVMPNTVLVIPLFLEVSTIGQLDRLWPVIVIMGFFPFGVYLAFIQYRTTLPIEVVEAARIDGSSEVGTFLRVGLPLAKQAVALVGFFAFVADWTNYFLPLVLLPDAAQSTLPVGLGQLISSSQLFNPTAAAGLNVVIDMPELVLAAGIEMMPVLIIFLLAQRYLVRGTMVGAVR